MGQLRRKNKSLTKEKEYVVSKIKSWVLYVIIKHEFYYKIIP